MIKKVNPFLVNLNKILNFFHIFYFYKIQILLKNGKAPLDSLWDVHIRQIHILDHQKSFFIVYI